MTDNIKNEILELKQQLKDKQSKFRDKKGLLNESDLKKMKLYELKELVKLHKLFKGYTNLKKSSLIDKIMEHKWFERQKPVLPPKLKKTEIIEELPPIPVVPKEENKKSIPPPPPPPPPPVKKDEKKEELKDLEDLEDLKKSNEKLTRKQKRRLKLGLKDTSTKDEPTEVNIDDEDKIHIGHAIINIYTGGSSNPNMPIPQSVVRHAINAQTLPPQQQQNISNFLQQEAKNANVPLSKPKKFPPVQTTQPNKQITKLPPKGKKGKKQIKAELKNLPKSSGFSSTFKQRLENKIASQMGLDLPFPDLEDEDEDDDE